MSNERMSDERLANVQANADLHGGFPDAYSGDLLQALKAERAEVKRLRAALERARKAPCINCQRRAAMCTGKSS